MNVDPRSKTDLRTEVPRWPRGFPGGQSWGRICCQYLPSLKPTFWPLKIGRPKRKQSSSNHPFSGANLLLVSGSVECGSEDQVDLYCNVLGKRRFRRKCAFCQCKKFFFQRYSVHLAKLDEIWCQPGSMLELRTKCFDRLTLKGATKKQCFCLCKLAS